MQKLLPALLCLLLPVFMFSQNRYDIVIDEIMADPSPAVGLPASEWIELKNTGAIPFNLQNWRIGDATGQSGPLPNFILQPDSFVLICSSSAMASLSAFGTTLPVTSFPSLDNDGDILYLKTAGGIMMHAVHYSADWYSNEVKKEGGWTLEMIDTGNPCGGAGNWTASTAATGGTPGRKNTADDLVPDDKAPILKRAYTAGPSTIILVFDEPVDSISGAAAGQYAINNGLLVLDAVTLPPLFTEVKLTTTAALTAGTIYTIRANTIKDCKGNTNANTGEIKTGVPADPLPGDWVINELLFNPRPNGDDYVEFLNNSAKILDASRLFIANRNSSGVVSNIKPLSATPFYILPGDHIAITTNALRLPAAYLVREPDHILEISAPPSFPDEEGIVVALNFPGEVVDEVHYKEDWHFKLLDNKEGVSLERIDPAGRSQDAQNWHSAASTAGYGTPGYKNSQYKLLAPANASIIISPKLFSPDNDGRDDIASIQYELSAPGFVANITVFNARGLPVRLLVRNGTLGLTGYWNWDGLDDSGNKLPVGTYIILTELFNLQGKKERFKNTVVLARYLK